MTYEPTPPISHRDSLFFYRLATLIKSPLSLKDLMSLVLTEVASYLNASSGCFELNPAETMLLGIAPTTGTWTNPAPPDTQIAPLSAHPTVRAPIRIADAEVASFEFTCAPPSPVALEILHKACEELASIIDRKSMIQRVNQARTIFSNAAFGALIVDQEKRIIESNTRFQEMLGYSAEELKGRTVLSLIHPEDQSMTQRAHALVESGRRPIEQTEKRGVRKNGELIWIRTSIRMVDESHDVSHYGTALIEDISERKAQEAKILEHQAQLVSASKMSALGEMAAGIAHEVNNPLAIILGHAQMLARILENKALDQSKAIEIAEKVKQTTLRIAKIVQGLRTFAGDGENGSAPLETVSMGAIIEDTLEFCRERFKSNGIQLMIEPQILASKDLEVTCRRVKISQVLLNLLTNAFDAAKGASVRNVTIEARKSDAWVELVVRDSGPGIPAELRDKIFQPFFTTKPVGSGTGLGLSIARGLAEAHGGTLKLAPSAKDTSFVLQLPRLQG